MKASLAIFAVASILGATVPVHAHKTAQVRRELQSQGYDQIEFKRKKPPFWIDACLGTELFHLHVDYYGKITKKTASGTCPGRDEPEEAAVQPEVAAPAQAGVVNENSSISTAQPQAGKSAGTKAADTAAEPKASTKAVDSGECKRFFPAIGMTLTVSCE